MARRVNRPEASEVADADSVRPKADAGPRDTTGDRDGRLTTLLSKIKAAYGQDETFTREYITANNFLYSDGVYLTRFGRIVIASDKGLQRKLLRAAHDDPLAGHRGTERTMELLKRNFHWHGMKKDVQEYVASCTSCQRHKTDRKLPAGLLRPLEVPTQFWEHVTLDFITCLPTTPRGHDALIVFVDKLSKMVQLHACNIKITGAEVAKIYHEKVFVHFGLAKKIISDRDARFTSHFSQALLEVFGVKHAASTAFHPQTDGQTEIMNRYVEDTIRHYVNPAQDDWDEWLVPVQFAINNTYQASIKTTSFRAIYGKDPHTPLTLELDAVKRVPKAKAWLDELVLRHERARYNALGAAERMKESADKRRRDVRYAEGDWVWLSTRNLKFRINGTKKFLPKYIGPFKILKAIGPPPDSAELPIGTLPRSPTAYKLDLPDTCAIHPVFHVSLLKSFKPRDGVMPTRPDPIAVDSDGVPVFEAQEIVKETVGKNKRYFLVRWKGYSEEGDTWQEEKDILAGGLLEAWRATHPGPAPNYKRLLRNTFPVSAYRPRTRNEDKRLQALVDKATAQRGLDPAAPADLAGSDSETSSADIDYACGVCGRTDFAADGAATMLLCDGTCGKGYHLGCLTPPLTAIPRTRQWFCPTCADRPTPKQARTKTTVPTDRRPSRRRAAAADFFALTRLRLSALPSLSQFRSSGGADALGRRLWQRTPLRL